MSYPIDYQIVKVSISEKEKKKAREFAKRNGMTFQGWLGNVIKKEIAREEQKDFINADRA